MIRSGIAPLDSRLGGVAPGRVHLISGGVGTGKTTACLHFIAAGLQAGETAALLTLDRPAELRSHAEYLGVGLETPLREGRLVALRFRPEFARRFARAASVESVAEDLRRAMGGSGPPARIAIDPVSPFLADGSPAGAGLAALIELIDGLGSTALLTYPGPLTAGADRRLDAVVDRAAVIASLSHAAEGGYEMRIARARLAGAPRERLRFMIQRAVGLIDAPRPNGGPARTGEPAVRAGNGRRPA